jgi:hypothetical protein
MAEIGNLQPEPTLTKLMLPITPKFTASNHQLPLAIYREIAAHLQQIEGITVAFLTPISRGFGYTESQLGGLEITGVDRLASEDRHRIEQIFSYYAERYQAWNFSQ